MNKTAIICGLVIFALAFLVPPFEYIDRYAQAAASVLGGSYTETEIGFRPIWSGGKSLGSNAEIATGLWIGILGGIAFFTFALASIIPKKSEAESEEDNIPEE